MSCPRNSLIALCLAALMLPGCASVSMKMPLPSVLSSGQKSEETVQVGEDEAESTASREATTTPSKALMLLKDNQLEAAEAELLAKLEREPSELASKTNLGLLYLHLGKTHQGKTHQGKTQQGAALLESVIAEKPSSCAAQVRLGQLHRANYDFLAAESAYNACLKANPDHPAALRNLGILYELYLGQLEDALQLYERYQDAVAEPDRQVNRWIADLSRRIEVTNRIAEVQHD